MILTSILSLFAPTILTAFVMTDGMVVAICGVLTTLIMQFFLVVMFLLKCWWDAKKAKLDKEAIEDVKAKGAERETRITEHVQAVGAKVDVLEGKADASYKEANNVNLKLESLGIQTKPLTTQTSD